MERLVRQELFFQCTDQCVASRHCKEALQRGIAKRQADTKDEDRTNYSLFRSNQIRLPTLKPKFLEAFKLKKHFCIRGEDLIGF